MGERFVILGAGGHALSTCNLIETCFPDSEIVGFCDPKPLPQTVLGRMGFEKLKDAFDISKNKGFLYAIGVGQISDWSPRARLHQKLEAIGVEVPNLISPKANVSSSAEFSLGCQVFAGAYVGAHVKVGKGTIVNSGCILEHEVIVGDYSHLSTGTIVNGQVSIGCRVFLGSGSIVSNNLEIACQSFVPLGSRIISSVGDSVVCKFCQ